MNMEETVSGKAAATPVELQVATATEIDSIRRLIWYIFARLENATLFLRMYYIIFIIIKIYIH